MELKILVATTKPLKGQWYELPSKELIQKAEEWEIEGKESLVLETSASFDKKVLKELKTEHFTVREWNQLAEKLSCVPDEILQNPDIFTMYEPLEEILEDEGQKFFSFELDTMTEVAEFLVQEELISSYMTDEELIEHYLDYEKLGRDLHNERTFFDGPYGKVQYISWKG